MPHPATTRHIGLDFGTTNSALAVQDGTGEPRLASFDSHRGPTSSFRSLLYFTRAGLAAPRVAAGPEAIRRYLGADNEGRLVQSLKSYLASRSLTSTSIFGRVYKLEELIAFILTDLREAAERRLGALGRRAVVGRPVRFVDSPDAASDAYAVERLREALRLSGFDDVEFVFEPVAAAHSYRTRLSREELVLIADFGGGTTDFSLVRLSPLEGSEVSAGVEIVGNAGLPIAGDCFDGRIVAALVAPALGHGSDYTSELGRSLPVPNWVYTHLRRWHYVSFLKTPRTLAMLRDMQRTSARPEGVEALTYLIENDLGFVLHRQVQAAKFALSELHQADFDLDHGPIEVHEPVERRSFEAWIAPDLAAVEATLGRLLSDCAVKAEAVDAVFMTGGSSFVPAVRAIFRNTFGAERIRSGDELTTIARGLALCCAHRPGP